MRDDLRLASEDGLLAIHRTELRLILERVSPSDLRLGEVLALIAVLGPVAARVQPAPALRIVR